MPSRHARHLCVPETILISPGGETDTVLLDERYTPYGRQKSRIENICGTFVEYINTVGLESVVKKSGTQKEVFHVQGNVVINQGKGAFMGVRSALGLERLSRVLSLESARNVVHMAVMTSKMGKRAQVSSKGLLETNLERHSGHLRVEGRPYDNTNTVRFTILRFDEPQFKIAPELAPDNNDWMVTGKGMVIIRLTWRRIQWTREVERECLVMCDRVTDWLAKCC
jgi:hypothetical protein